MLARLAALAAGLAVAGCAVVGDRSGTEEPGFEMLGRAGPVEIRRYAPRVVAETDVEGDAEAARNAGFRRLAGYIFGANRGGARIAMTAPVTQAPAEGTRIAMTAPVAQQPAGPGRWTVQFFMPSQWTLATLPAPEDQAVRLREVPGETMAVLRFSGDRGAEAVAARRAELLRILAGTAWAPQAEPVAWFYDPPWTLPWLRRNEVAVRVAGG
jgi:hypothetical protein